MEGTWNRSTINDKSIGTNLHLWRVCAHAKSTNKTSPAEPLPHPPYNVEKYHFNFVWFSVLCWVWTENSNGVLKGKQCFSQTSIAKHIQFMSRGLLSTIVDVLYVSDVYLVWVFARLTKRTKLTKLQICFKCFLG